MSRDFILNINRVNGYSTNISSPIIEPLYAYYRRRIGTPRFPMSDEQRILFDKLIINLCTEGYIWVQRWVLHDYFNIYNRPLWWESKNEEVPAKDGGILYKTIKEELKLICKLMKAKRIGATVELSSLEMEAFETIQLVDKFLADEINLYICEAM